MKNNMLLYKFLGPFENFNLKSEEIYLLTTGNFIYYLCKKKIFTF